jgi:F-box protein 21
MGIELLPDEILQEILVHIAPHDVLDHVQFVSRRFLRLCNEPLLWRHHCMADFTYWDSKYDFHQKFAEAMTQCDWKRLYRRRHWIDMKTSKVLDSILAEQTGRIKKFEQIGKYGYDAKDTLLRHCKATDDADDVLARRHAAPTIPRHDGRTDDISGSIAMPC